MSLEQRNRDFLLTQADMLAVPLKERSVMRRSIEKPRHEPVRDTRLTNIARVGFLLMVLAVLGGTFVVAQAHLTEQFLGAPEQTAGLIDPNTGQAALSPDYIEQQILRTSLNLRSDDLEIPAGSDPAQRTFTIVPGEAARFIADRLQSAGLITDADLFNLYMRVTGLERRLQAGTFRLSETMTMPEVADALRGAPEQDQVQVTIPEGFRAEEIAERLAANGVIEADRFLAAVREPGSLGLGEEYDFLQALPAGASLEGFLFPDTYFFPVFAGSPEVILGSFLDNFDKRVGTNGLRGGGSGISGLNLLTLASIVEREAVQADERPLIASVYLNRINGACEADVGGRFLQADPTVQYARGEAGDWWWEPESVEQYQEVISPYNTYINEGLPPGPIASPGLSAIDGTRNPESTNYCFFLATGEDGRHVFAQTYAEHQQNIAAYGYE